VKPLKNNDGWKYKKNMRCGPKTTLSGNLCGIIHLHNICSSVQSILHKMFLPILLYKSQLQPDKKHLANVQTSLLLSNNPGHIKLDIWSTTEHWPPTKRGARYVKRCTRWQFSGFYSNLLTQLEDIIMGFCECFGGLGCLHLQGKVTDNRYTPLFASMETGSWNKSVM
jgi:hypothetical protein